MSCLNGFRTTSARYKHYNGHVKVKMTSEKEKWLKFHDGLYQFKVPFMLGTSFEKFREKIYQMKTQQKGKTPY